MNGHDQFVYFIKPVGRKGPIKIGVSTKPEERLSGLMAWSPVQLEIIATVEGGFSLEHNIHACFADCHSHREWFKPAPRLLAAIEKIVAGVPVGDAIDLKNRVGAIRKRGKSSCDFTPYDRMCARVETEIEKERAQIAALRDEIDAATPASVEMAFAKSSEKVDGEGA